MKPWMFRLGLRFPADTTIWASAATGISSPWRSGVGTSARCPGGLPGLVAIAVVVAVHVLLTSRQEYTQADISPYFWVNGRPPASQGWSELAKNGFACWKLQVTGLVEQPLVLSLAEIRAMPSKRQITQHCCIQGWSAFAEWTGVPFG